MEQGSLLVPQAALAAASKTFLRESQQMLAVELHLTALNAKTEPESELVAFMAHVIISSHHHHPTNLKQKTTTIFY